MQVLPSQHVATSRTLSAMSLNSMYAQTVVTLACPCVTVRMHAICAVCCVV